jgi:hypothetical protein
MDENFFHFLSFSRTKLPKKAINQWNIMPVSIYCDNKNNKQLIKAF